VGRLLFRLHLRPNHLTLCGLGVSLLAAACFVAGRTRLGGALLILAGLFDFFDGSLARASGQVTPFGAFLDSVIDRYSDLVVLLGIVVLLARTPNARGALVAMAGERLHPPGWTEISAVCTHPDFRGRGLAGKLMRVLIDRIVSEGDAAFLHVYPDNAGAIALYGALGFRLRAEMTFTVLRSARR